MTGKPTARRGIVVLLATFVAFAALSANAFAQSSSKVAVVPGFGAPVYPGFFGVPNFPTSRFPGYQFTAVGSSNLTSAKLQGFDTVILYGLKWDTLSATAQKAIDDFAKTGKVIIWDADSTGPQDYSTFVHPFSTQASGEHGTKAGAVVTYPAGDDPLASSNPSSPLYLDPAAMIPAAHLIGHMSVMNAGAAEWTPGLIADNARIPGGGWVLAWGYGDTGDHSGMVIYSGLDADGFGDSANPNYAIKEMQIELTAAFSTTVDATCSPNCTPPPVETGSGGGGSGGGRGTFAECSLVKPAPRSWVRGSISLYVKTGVATGLKVRALDHAGRQLASGTPTKAGRYTISVNTRRLRTNTQARILIVVEVGTKRACSLPVLLKVDNTPPRIMQASAKRELSNVAVAFRVSENATVTIVSRKHVRRMRVTARTTVHVTLSGGAISARITARDRAGNTTTKRLRIK